MINKEEITDLFFDLDHTLYDFDKNSEITFLKIFDELNFIGVDDFMVHFKPINEYYWDLLSKNQITHEHLRYARLKDTFVKMNLSITDDQIDLIARKFIENLTQNTFLFEGAIESLDYLKQKYNLHIITNGPDKVQEAKLKNSNLEHYFQTVTNSEVSGVKKPNQGIFNYALNLAKTEAKNSVMIGDNLSADVHGALNVGMKVIWFNESDLSFDHKNVQEIRKLQELIKIL